MASPGNQQTDGFLLIDKPLGWTSHDVVAKARHLTGIRRIGHGGTLDPLATGLLVLGLGSATKQLDRFVQGDKTYVATVRLGATSTTDDGEGEITESALQEPPAETAVRRALEEMRGPCDQLSPVYSALKTAGKKHYQLARAGKPVEREARPIVIHELALLEYDWPSVRFRCRVSKGTYVRAMARDLGASLGTGGYLEALRREAVGDSRVADAVPIDPFPEDWATRLLPTGR